MPGYDRSGPMGERPRTGWGLGRCGRAAGGARAVEEPLQDDGASIRELTEALDRVDELLAEDPWEATRDES